MANLPGNLSYFWSLATLGGVYVIFTLLRFGAREKNLPPGPPTLPIIGNLHVVVDKQLYRRLVQSYTLLVYMTNQG